MANESVRHRGYNVNPHGNRWRFKWNRLWVTKDTLAGALEERESMSRPSWNFGDGLLIYALS